jgi:hypothetical protein
VIAIALVLGLLGIGAFLLSFVDMDRDLSSADIAKT